MKAILVVDIPTEMLNDNTCVNITSINSGMSFSAKLKPMPQPKKLAIDNYDENKAWYINGYNECLCEILGVENE